MCVSLCLVPRDALRLFTDCKLILQFRNGFGALQYKLILSLVLPEVVMSLVAFSWPQGPVYLWSQRPSAWWTFSLRQVGAKLCISSGCKQVISASKKNSFLVYEIETTCVICPLGKTWAKQSNSKVPAITPFNASMFSCLWEQRVNEREVPPRLPWFPFWKHSSERKGLLADLPTTQQTRVWLTLWWFSPTWLIFSFLDLPELAWLTVWLQDSKGDGGLWGRGGTKLSSVQV